MPGILDILLSGAQDPRLRLGGTDTPAGGGALDPVGQRIMQEQARASGGILGSFGSAPVQGDTTQPASGIPGLLGRIFGAGTGSGSNYEGAVRWLQSKGYSAEAASIIARNKDMLDKAVIAVGAPSDPANPKDNLITVGENSSIYDAASDKWITNPNAKQDEAKAPTVQTFYDEQTGQEYKAQWDAQKGWVPVGGQKIPKEGITVTSPDGTVMTIGGGSNTKLTEGQSKDVLYYTRGIDANKSLDMFEGELTDIIQSGAGKIPLGLGNYLQSPQFQQAKQAGDNFLAAILRKDTGAAVTKQEFQLYGEMFLPVPGDSPEVVKQKRRARQVALDAIKSGMGTAEAIATANEQKLGINPAAPKGDRPGKSTVIDGYTIEELD